MAGAKGQIVNPVVYLVLSFVTCGLFGLYWLYVIIRDVNAHQGKDVVSMTMFLVGILCFPLNIYNMYLIAKALPEMQKSAGLEAKDESVLILILAIFLYPAALLIVQGHLNAIWQKAA